MTIPLKRFDAFMEEALFHPKHGYYSKLSQVGKRGDFSTSATLSPSFGKAIFRWIQKASRRTGIRHVIEIGPGNGKLAHTLLKELGWLSSWKGWHYHLVEISPTLRETQKKLLGNRVHWHASIQEALQSCGGKALILSNEVIDAFPCRRVQKVQDGWQECYVGRHPNGFLRAYWKSWIPSETELECDFSAWVRSEELPEKQVIELHESFSTWIRDWLSSWKAGESLWIDYGDEFPVLYRPHPLGTLRGYANHHRLDFEGILENAGRCDLTADVNFTDIRCWFKREGLQETRWQTQRDFLLEHQDGRSSKDEAWSYLVDPEGPGGAFKVLGVARPLVQSTR